MKCDMCECESTLYFDNRGRQICHHCFWDTMDRDPTVEERAIEGIPKSPRHFCETCTWMDVRAAVVGGYDGMCRIHPEPRMVCRRDFCGEHPAALRERQELLSPALDTSAALSVAVGQFMGNYFSKALNTPGEDPKNTRTEDERTLQEIAESIAEAIIADFTNDKTAVAWTVLSPGMRKAIRERWIELVKDRL